MGKLSEEIKAIMKAERVEKKRLKLKKAREIKSAINARRIRKKAREIKSAINARRIRKKK